MGIEEWLTLQEPGVPILLLPTVELHLPCSAPEQLPGMCTRLYAVSSRQDAAFQHHLCCVFFFLFVLSYHR